MKRIEGWRTFSIIIICITVLILGLWLVPSWHRKEVFAFFAGALVGLAGAQAAKSVGTSAVSGDGLTNGIKNLLSDRKPGDSK